MKSTILYDDIADGRLAADHGFSCLIETDGKNILFDSGTNGGLLLSNMNRVGANYEDIDYIFISHDHHDHTGGLISFLEVKGNIPVYVPNSMSDALKNKIKSYAPIIEISNAGEICKNVYTTGELGSNIKEQSIMVKTKKGNVVITGCAHPGLDNILKKAQGFGKIHAVIGGFHGFSNFAVLKDVEKVLPCHCTLYKQKIIADFPEKAVKCMAGSIFEVQ